MKPNQSVNINNDSVACEVCGANLVDIANFVFAGEVISNPTYREEQCTCRHCGTPFILHYDFFDEEGHIHSRVFSEDINNPSYHWTEVLTDEQKSVISGHLRGCKICQDRLDQELLADAWLKDVMAQLRKTAKI